MDAPPDTALDAPPDTPPDAPLDAPLDTALDARPGSIRDGAVRVSGLRKSFRVKGGTAAAVTGIDLAVAAGEIFGLLGPNGAGKTTTLRILTTLLPADGGEAVVAGADVRREPRLVRRRIGYVGQLGGADANATGRENLLLAGRLYGLSSAAARQRATELLTVFDLSALADRGVRTYSGGQKRRLEVALGIMHEPRVLFLDEPTTGLDPQNRANLWDQLRRLRARGATIVITTHYLDEADQLCDRVAIVDHGTVIALGTPEELKRRYSGKAITLTPNVPPADLPGLAGELARQLAARGLVAPADGTGGPGTKEEGTGAERTRAEGTGGTGRTGGTGGTAEGSGRAQGATVSDATIRLAVTDTTLAMAAACELLAARGIELADVSVARPTLDDVFLNETGKTLRDTGVHQ
jgi:ABC-2 type transport system ATP-binding protein